MDNILLKLICQEKNQKSNHEAKDTYTGLTVDTSAIMSKYQLLDFSLITQYHITKQYMWQLKQYQTRF